MTERLRIDLAQQEKQKNNVKNFIAAVKKYTDLNDLDATVLREFIHKIYISKTSGKIGGKHVDEPREIEIVYNFIGAFDFPKAMEQSKSKSNTKKIGVA